MDRIDVAKRLLRMAKAVADDMSIDPLAMQVVQFLKANPNPKDSDLHKWADENKMDIEEVEAAAYRLATLAVSFAGAGRANEKGFSAKDADPVELSMGIQVEREHTDSLAMAKRIALDHLAEVPDYYRRLKKMEAEAGIKG